jgi:hypothetical protein
MSSPSGSEQVVRVVLRGRNGSQRSTPRNGTEVKKDILGYFPGMSKEEFLGRRKNGCGGLTAQFTKKLDQNLIKEIQFKFMSGTPPAEMIHQVTEQFKIKPIKADWSAEIKHATEGRMEYMPAIFFGKGQYALVVGGLIAKWRLDQNLSLNLNLNKPAAGTTPNEYYLVLSNKGLARLETQTEQNRIKEQEMRLHSVNPRQRF